MTTMVKVEAEGGNMLFEANVSEHRLQEIGVMDGIIDGVSSAAEKLTTTIQSCLDSIEPVFERERDKGAKSLNKAEVKFGISVDAEGDIYVVKAAGGANLEITLSWDLGGD